MNFCVLADLFREDIVPPVGGGEMATDSLIQLLRLEHGVITRRTQQVSPEFIRSFEGVFIISNRQFLSNDCKIELYKKDYILYEHDFHWIKGRDIGVYEDFKVPEADIINRDIYQHAKKVIFQSQAQQHAAKINLKYDNFFSSSGNPWSQDDLDYLKSLQGIEKTKGNVILQHPYPTKGTEDAIYFCDDNGWEYDLLPPMPQREFWRALAEYKLLIFLPQVFETYSRVSCAAAMLG